MVTVKSVRVPATMMKKGAAIEGTPEGLLGSAISIGVPKNMKTAQQRRPVRDDQHLRPLHHVIITDGNRW